LELQTGVDGGAIEFSFGPDSETRPIEAKAGIDASGDGGRSGRDLTAGAFAETVILPMLQKAAQPDTAEAGEVMVTRHVHFNSAHRLHNPKRGRKWNERVFGPCSNPNGHGHNYVIEVTVRGRPDPETGYVIDLGDLKRILERAVVDPCDHRNLNVDVDFLRGTIPTTENLVVAFWKRIEPRIRSGRLHCVRLYETPRNFAEYHGPTSLS
jgi:6-pyruvoyltetrahydropterin/6-carboxytetrahydropterin synthase